MGLRLPSSKYFEVKHPRCVFQLEFFFYSKQPDTTGMCHLKTKHVMLEAIAGVSRQSVNF